ncbi:MAG: DUF4418 family protein [Lachnospiraceae bacterium]|nr:DUF4418 family protein [Lachnospiraceae bacterium]
MKAHKIINIIEILVLGIIIAGLFTFAHVCGSMGGMEAPCHKTKAIALVVAIALIVLAVVQIALNKQKVNTAIAVIQTVGGAVIALLPGVIAPVCSMKSMHCYVYTRPLLIILGILIAGIGIVDIVILLKKK